MSSIAEFLEDDDISALENEEGQRRPKIFEGLNRGEYVSNLGGDKLSQSMVAKIS